MKTSITLPIPLSSAELTVSFLIPTDWTVSNIDSEYGKRFTKSETDGDVCIEIDYADMATDGFTSVEESLSNRAAHLQEDRLRTLPGMSDATIRTMDVGDGIKTLRWDMTMPKSGNMMSSVVTNLLNAESELAGMSIPISVSLNAPSAIIDEYIPTFVALVESVVLKYPSRLP